MRDAKIMIYVHAWQFVKLVTKDKGTKDMIDLANQSLDCAWQRLDDEQKELLRRNGMEAA